MMNKQNEQEKVLQYIKDHPNCNALEISDNAEIRLWVVYAEVENLYKDGKIKKHFTVKGVLYTSKE